MNSYAPFRRAAPTRGTLVSPSRRERTSYVGWRPTVTDRRPTGDTWSVDGPRADGTDSCRTRTSAGPATWREPTSAVRTAGRPAVEWAGARAPGVRSTRASSTAGESPIAPCSTASCDPLADVSVRSVLSLRGTRRLRTRDLRRCPRAQPLDSRQVSTKSMAPVPTDMTTKRKSRRAGDMGRVDERVVRRHFVSHPRLGAAFDRVQSSWLRLRRSSSRRRRSRAPSLPPMTGADRVAGGRRRGRPRPASWTLLGI